MTRLAWLLIHVKRRIAAHERTTRYTVIAFAAALLLAPRAALHAADAPKPPAKPNIVYFLADDMGYADPGFMGCKDIKTPNMDKLARTRRDPEIVLRPAGLFANARGVDDGAIRRSAPASITSCRQMRSGG